MELPFYKNPIIWVGTLIVFILIFLLLLYNPFYFGNSNLSSKLSHALSREPKPGSCLILEEKYCKLAKLIPNPNDQKGQLAVFKVPKGTMLFAPIDGFYLNTPVFSFKDPKSDKYSSFPGVVIAVGKYGESKYINYTYDFIYYNYSHQFSLPKIKKGDIIGTISDRTINYLGDYNLIITVSKHNNINGKIHFSNDTNKLKDILNIR